MEELGKLRGVELVKKLDDAQGVLGCSTEELFIVSHPKGEVGPLFGFTKKDLDAAIELKLLHKTTTSLNINGKECPVYMKTVNAANND